MSGLLVKSTVVMKENLDELNSRGMAGRWPVLLGGAALTRAYVEQDLAALFDGEVRYARDAFEGLRLMDAVMAVKRGDEGAALPERRTRKVNRPLRALDTGDGGGAALARSDVAELTELPEPPFWGARAVTGIAPGRVRALPGRAGHVHGPVGAEAIARRGRDDLRGTGRGAGRPRLRMWLERARTEGLLEPAVVYGYFPCVSEGNDLVILDEDGKERERFTFPRQRRDRRLCLADFFAPRESGRTDVVAFQLATVGRRVSEATGELFAKNAYRDYLELHGLSVQLTEALAEYWHTRVRRELGIGDQDSDDIEDFFRLGSGRAVLVRLPGLPGPGRPGQGGPPAAPRGDRGRAHRRDAACSRTVHRRARGPSPRSEILQHVTNGSLQAVLFDMDGLLIDSEPLWFEVETEVMTRLGGTWSPADQETLLGSSLDNAVRYFMERAAVPADPAEVGEWMVSGIVDKVHDHGVRIMPGATELVAAVAAAGLPYALVTSSQRRFVDAVLARTGLRFPVMVTGERRHPQQAPSRAVPARRQPAGVPPGRCLVLEDSITGVTAAEAAGCFVVAVPTLGGIEPRPGRWVRPSLTGVDVAWLRQAWTEGHLAAALATQRGPSRTARPPP